MELKLSYNSSSFLISTSRAIQRFTTFAVGIMAGASGHRDGLCRISHRNHDTPRDIPVDYTLR